VNVVLVLHSSWKLMQKNIQALDVLVFEIITLFIENDLKCCKSAT
jgi:hypothetical protein